MSDEIDAIEIEEELIPGFVMAEKPCWIPGCGGTIRLTFTHYLEFAGHRTEIGRVACTIGGEEHIR